LTAEAKAEETAVCSAATAVVAVPTTPFNAFIRMLICDCKIIMTVWSGERAVIPEAVPATAVVAEAVRALRRFWRAMEKAVTAVEMALMSAALRVPTVPAVVEMTPVRVLRRVLMTPTRVEMMVVNVTPVLVLAAWTCVSKLLMVLVKALIAATMAVGSTAFLLSAMGAAKVMTAKARMMAKMARKLMENMLDGCLCGWV